MKVDTHMFLQVQIAFMGVLAAAGIFFLWRQHVRISGEVDRLRQDVHTAQAWMASPPAARGSRAPRTHIIDEDDPGDDGQGEEAARAADDAADSCDEDEDEEDDGVFVGFGGQDAEDARKMMERVFGVPSSVFFQPMGFPPPPEPQVKITELAEEPRAAPPAPSAPAVSPPAVAVAVAPEEARSEAGTSVRSARSGRGGLSKSKLRKMPVEALKEVCATRHLSADGNKAALLERIFATMDA